MFLDSIEFDLSKCRYKYSLNYNCDDSETEFYKRVDSYVFYEKKKLLIGLLKHLDKLDVQFNSKLEIEDINRLSKNNRAHARFFAAQKETIIGTTKHLTVFRVNDYWVLDNPGTNGFKDLLRCICIAGNLKCKEIR